MSHDLKLSLSSYLNHDVRPSYPVDRVEARFGTLSRLAAENNFLSLNISLRAVDASTKLASSDFLNCFINLPQTV